MKLTYFQLEAHLKKNLSTIYIVSGEELLLKRDARISIRKAAKLAGFTEHLQLMPETGFDWGELYTFLYSTSLLAEKRLLELDLYACMPNKTANTILQEYGENQILNQLLLIDIGKMDDKIAKSGWYKSLEKKGVILSIWPIPREQLPTWIANYAKKYNIHFQGQAAEVLADYVEGNLVAAQQAIEKIHLLQPSKSIEVDLIHSIMTDETHFTIFEFIENLIGGKIARTLHILENLRENGMEPTLILWGITRELRLLAEMIQSYQQGITYEILFQKNRIHLKRQGSIRYFLTKHSLKDCWQYLIQAAELDKLVKGGVAGDVWNALQLFCLRMV